MKEEKYSGIDYLRAIACIGIVMMHMMANNNYALAGFAADRLIPSFTNFVFLFMTISAFGMCCGYYKKVLSGAVNWTEFYKKRYLRILPFFAVLVVIDLVVNFSLGSLYEGIADISLLFGLFPNDIKVIGVGWFLGLVFVFYLIFPFYCVLLENKKRAWIAFAASLVLNYVCGSYFAIDRRNIVFSLCFFLAGGLIYLYRDAVERSNRFVLLIITVIATVLYYLLGANTCTILFLSSALLVAAISFSKILKLPWIVSFISGISMEIYLSHMVIFRAIEKVHLNTCVGNGWVQYCITTILVIAGTIMFSVVVKSVINKLMKKIGSAS